MVVTWPLARGASREQEGGKELWSGLSTQGVSGIVMRSISCPGWSVHVYFSSHSLSTTCFHILLYVCYTSQIHIFIKKCGPLGTLWALTHWQNYFTGEVALLDLLRGLSPNGLELQGGSPWIPLKLGEAAFLTNALLAWVYAHHSGKSLGAVISVPCHHIAPGSAKATA